MGEENYKLQTEEPVSADLRVSFESDAFRDVVNEAAYRYSIEGERKQVLLGILSDIYIGRVEEDEMAEALSERLDLSVEDAINLYADIYADLLYDIEDILMDQRMVYTAMHPAEFLPPRPEERDPHEVLADEVVAKSGVALDDERMRKRLFDIVLARIKDVRDEAETRNMLTKPSKTGGMELEEGKAATVLLFANEAKGNVEKKREEIRKEVEEYDRTMREAEEKKEERAAAESHAPKVFTKDDAKRIFAGSTEEREALKGYVSRLAVLAGPDDVKAAVLEMAAEAVGDEVPDSLAVTAGLSMMADSGTLIDALGDEGFREQILAHVPEEKSHEIRQRIIADSKSAEAMSAFLQAFYRYVAGVSVEESARLGLRVVKALSRSGRDRYSQLVAFDMDNGVFVWTE